MNEFDAYNLVFNLVEQMNTRPRFAKKIIKKSISEDPDKFYEQWKDAPLRDKIYFVFDVVDISDVNKFQQNQLHFKTILAAKKTGMSNKEVLKFLEDRNKLGKDINSYTLDEKVNNYMEFIGE